MALAVNLLRVSPIAIGLTSPFDLGNAVRREHDNRGTAEGGTLPSAISKRAKIEGRWLRRCLEVL